MEVPSVVDSLRASGISLECQNENRDKSISALSMNDYLNENNLVNPFVCKNRFKILQINLQLHTNELFESRMKN